MNIVAALGTLVVFAVYVALVVWWVMVLLDCIKNEPTEGNDRVIWVLVIVLLSWLGAIIYVLGRKPARVQKFGR